MCAMAHRFLKWRIEIFAMRHNGAHFFCYGASTKSWCAINFLKTAEITIAEDDLVKIFSFCGAELISANFQLIQVVSRMQNRSVFRNNL